MMLWIILFLIGLHHGVNTQCVERGRFPNDMGEDCRGYTMCIAASFDSFVQYNLTCPPNTIYSHMDQQCTNATGYHCLSNYNCTGLGNFSDPHSENCSSYVTCIQGLEGLISRLVDCPINTVFNQSICVGDTAYTCPSIMTTHTNSASVIRVLTSGYLFIFICLVAVLNIGT